MSNVVRVETSDRVARILIDRPPVNAMNVDVRRGLLEALSVLRGDAGIDGAILAGAGGRFCAGSDIEEFDAPPAAPSSVEVFAALENFPKPLVAAIAGVAFGGGLELALACAYRVASPDARLGLPEVKLGMLPGGGGTQRLPRLVGFDRAAPMIFRGEPVSAKEAEGSGLIDAVVEGDLLEAAVAFLFARRGDTVRPAAARSTWIDRVREDRPAFEALLKDWTAKAREKKSANAIAEAFRAAVDLPFDQALQRERALFVERRDSAEAKAQRYLFFAERDAAKVGLDAPSVRPVDRTAVVGAGTMGVGIAMALANAGLPVALIDSDEKTLDRAAATIATNYRRQIESGALTAIEAARREESIRRGTAITAAGDCQLVIEAVFEDLGLKKEIFATLDRVTARGTILATNTSTLDVDAIAAATTRPGDVLGLHFFSPAHIMRLVEVVKGRATAPDVLKTAVMLARKMGKATVVVGVCDGFVGNRMHLRRAPNVERLLQEGVMPATIDRVATAFGFAMGPCATSDLTGLDVQWRIRQAKGIRYPVADALCEMGRLGQKAGAGYYRYDPGSRRPLEDPVVHDLIRKTAVSLGNAPRAIGDEEILDRLLLPMINEGAGLLEEGIARCPADIDVVWATGYGWPTWRGGPMYFADHIGLITIRDRLERYSTQLGDETLRPARLIKALAAAGRGFSSLPAARV
ncbi:MAG: 3-hydroxyacyl-CoA dehydrogenase [Alphaproteobacteria bacterium]|nr:3-hydroxyacyl-CoA dehydrogenase [Alphaproteobacteria bacterium]